MDLPELMTAKEVKDYLKCSNENLYALLKTRGFPSFKIGNTYRIRKDEFIDWINKQKLNLKYYK